MKNAIPLQRGLESWKPTHSHAIERYFGTEAVEKLAYNMRSFYWPVFIGGTPEPIYAMPGGDFCGDLKTNGEVGVEGRWNEYFGAYRNRQRARLASHVIHHDLSLRGRIDRQMHAFASDDAVLAAETGGKLQRYSGLVKTGVASNAIGNGIDLWTALTSNPVAGAAAAAAPGGTVPDRTTTGAIPYVNPASAGTGHFRAASNVQASVANMSLLLYDRIFAVAKTMNSTANEAVSGVPNRYTSQVSTSLSYIGGNFLFPSIPTTILPATGHNWVLGGSGNGGCTFTDEGGNTGINLPLIAGVSACVLRGIDLAPLGTASPGWFMPLGGKVGIKALTKMELSAAVATGTIDMVIGHPIAFLPCYVAQMLYKVDALYGDGPRLPHIEDNACLAVLELPKSATTATTYVFDLSFIGE